MISLVWFVADAWHPFLANAKKQIRNLLYMVMAASEVYARRCLGECV